MEVCCDQSQSVVAPGLFDSGPVAGSEEESGPTGAGGVGRPGGETAQPRAPPPKRQKTPSQAPFISVAAAAAIANSTAAVGPATGYHPQSAAAVAALVDRVGLPSTPTRDQAAGYVMDSTTFYVGPHHLSRGVGSQRP